MNRTIHAIVFSRTVWGQILGNLYSIMLCSASLSFADIEGFCRSNDKIVRKQLVYDGL